MIFIFCQACFNTFENTFWDGLMVQKLFFHGIHRKYRSCRPCQSPHHDRTSSSWTFNWELWCSNTASRRVNLDHDSCQYLSLTLSRLFQVQQLEVRRCISVLIVWKRVTGSTYWTDLDKIWKSWIFGFFRFLFQFLVMETDGWISGCVWGGVFFVREQKISILELKYAWKHVSEPAEPLETKFENFDFWNFWWNFGNFRDFHLSGAGIGHVIRIPDQR